MFEILFLISIVLICQSQFLPSEKKVRPAAVKQTRRCRANQKNYWTSSNSTSKIKAEFGGIAGGAPRSA